MLDANALAALKQLKTDIKETKEIFTGTVKGSFSRFGFVICDQHDAEYFLAPNEMDKVIPGDKIEFEKFEDAKGKSYAEVTKLIKSEFNQFVGQYSVKGTAHFVSPEESTINRSFFLPPKERKGNNQDFILCQLTRHPFPDGKGQAKVLKVIGNKGSAFLEHDFTRFRFGLEQEFPLNVSQQADQYQDAFIASEKVNRMDHTSVPFVTIDNPNSKDMDDALWAEATDTGYRLKIAIADPSSWIQPGTAMDLDAKGRVTSTYLPGQTIHMLPARMAHNLCSLVAGFDRLALVLSIELDTDANIVTFQFESSVIKSQGKLNYQQVTDWLENQTKKSGWTGDVEHSLITLNQLTEKLRLKRATENLVMNDRDDFRFELDDMGKILSIRKEPKTVARRLVEECMLLTNRVGARFLAEHKTGLFIGQPGIRTERIADIQQIISEEAPELAELDISTLAGFIELMQKTEQSYPDIRAILGKQFNRAEISNQLAPHFAQGFEGYSTITSPIRRYLDLENHRQIHQILAGKKPPVCTNELAEHIQQKQSHSRQASNIVESWLLCHYMENFIDLEYEAEVNFVNGIGFGVRLPDNGIEGFVNIKDLSPKTEYDGKRMVHKIGEQVVKLNDTIRVKVTGSDMERKQIQFAWLDHPGNTKSANN